MKAHTDLSQALLSLANRDGDCSFRCINVLLGAECGYTFEDGKAVLIALFKPCFPCHAEVRR